MFLGVIRLNFLNSLLLVILNKFFDISTNSIFFSKNKWTNLSLAETITVSYSECCFGTDFKIFITGNLFLSTFLKFKLLIILKSNTLDLSFF